MSLTLSKVRSHVIGNRKHYITDVTLDASYPSGGYALSASTLGPDILLDTVHVQQGVGGLLFSYNYTTSKLQAYLPTGGGGTGTFGNPTGAVPAGATGVTSTGAQPAITINPGVAKEVPAATDLHTVTVRVEAFGKGTAGF